ncbi:tannase and feruloyl esterase [Macroventuria anomochaeta]|uniref:Tannase and feruloyl esterase n=1 Tax=Macroventuria anomochaeta TaxID=301207 RepID=A0ACB6SEH8_9PLEO|nr:tannase and feruloyl esterase [Macroventuria anomochaeta]KAF2632005.1 tannase and feruloyl esterase [Macroventuria anomochaeta]
MLAALISLSLLLLSASVTGSTAFEKKCLAFEPEKFVPGATRNVLQYVAANTTLTFPDNVAACNRGTQAVTANICRVALSINTSKQSNITFEAWLPEDWSGRFLATGNGGIDGCIKYEDIAYTSSNGFAAVGSNNGKNGTDGLPFFNNPETVIDFAWRALHTSADAGKSLVTKLYGKSHSKSYYLGCSLGGRQGIKSAEKFPDDFDGIVAGAPAVDFNNLVSWRARFFTITGAVGSPDFIPATAWKTWIHDEVLRQCDTIDKAKDGIIEDPMLCNFNPSTLLCKGNSTGNCLLGPHVQQLKKIFSDYRFPNGQLIFPAMQPGSEVLAVDRLYAGAPFAYSANWFKYALYNDPAWNASTFDFDDVRAAESLNPGDIRTYPISLSGFERRGGKIVTYHGQQDNQITTFNTIRWYNDLKGYSSTAAMDRWIRFFRVSGMNHCNSGPGAWVLGQGGNAAAAGVPFERKKNVLKAVVDWVEQGVAPPYIEGTKFVNDTVSLGVDFTRRHCKYPLRNTFVGANFKDPESWKCT